MKIISSILLILLLIAGCEKAASPPEIEVRVFGDRSDATYEWVFAFRGTDIVAQRHAFPGYEEPVIFSFRTESPPIPSEFFVGPGNIQPPFEPGGSWFYRVDVPVDDSVEVRIAFFEDESHELRQALSDLETKMQSRGERLEALPDWIAESQELRSYFGHY